MISYINIFFTRAGHVVVIDKIDVIIICNMKAVISVKLAIIK